MSKKIKKVFNKPSLIKEWNDTSFKDLPKRWTGAYGRKNGLTEFEDYCGGKDNIKLGKLYTDKDRPPFATNKQIQELKLQEEFAIDDEGWNSVKGMVKGFFEDLQNVTNSIKGKNLKDLYGVLDNINRRQLGIKSVLKKHMKTDDEEVTEGIKRWKVYIKGESKPLILTGKNEKDVKQLAHAMINNNSIKIAKVVKEEKLTEGKRVKYRKNDWKKYNQLVKRGKSVMVQTAFGDQFAWEDGSNYGVFASEESGREIELDHDDIDMVEIF